MGRILWRIGRVAIWGGKSDVYVTPRGTPPREGRRRDKPPGKGASPMKNQTFGIEIETTGLGRRRTAEALARFFGTKRRRA